ncbi:hypothetical protein [Pseudonocardia sp. HH130630-07]|uniref:hypothetical protein n=1 Tax=Pseudonocardia sp. HH130630-07 TaxID=1690815 RepID=UPI000839CB34|nr:hypothetical protein [Pseudonocardia sp. HH130630-07]
MSGARRAACGLLLLVLAGCGVTPAGVTDAGPAPTGVAPGPTVFFLGPAGELRGQVRPIGHLGTISDALALLLAGPGGSGLGTGIAPAGVQRAGVVLTPAGIDVRVPLTIGDVTPAGVDQIVCTALAVHVVGGGARDTTVRVDFVQPTPESDVRRRCPVIR